jgi:hypothetical protein
MRACRGPAKVWIEYLSTSDLGQGVAAPSPRRVGGCAPSALGGPWFGESLSMAFVALVRLARAFHTRGVRVAWRTHDMFHAYASTIELGYSVFPGGALLHMHARRHGIAYERRATALAHRDALGPLVERAAPVAWDFLARRYPSIAREMLREVGRYGIYGTGFSKVTVAYDNPTCVHYDSNFGADVVMAFRLRSLKGGEHVMLSVDGCEAVVVETSELGVLIGGSHAHLLHGNLGTTDAEGVWCWPGTCPTICASTRRTGSTVMSERRRRACMQMKRARFAKRGEKKPRSPRTPMAPAERCRPAAALTFFARERERTRAPQTKITNFVRSGQI